MIWDVLGGFLLLLLIAWLVSGFLVYDYYKDYYDASPAPEPPRGEGEEDAQSVASDSSHESS